MGSRLSLKLQAFRSSCVIILENSLILQNQAGKSVALIILWIVIWNKGSAKNTDVPATLRGGFSSSKRTFLAQSVQHFLTCQSKSPSILLQCQSHTDWRLASCFRGVVYPLSPRLTQECKGTFYHRCIHSPVLLQFLSSVSVLEYFSSLFLHHSPLGCHVSLLSQLMSLALLPPSIYPSFPSTHQSLRSPLLLDLLCLSSRPSLACPLLYAASLLLAC